MNDILNIIKNGNYEVIIKSKYIHILNYISIKDISNNKIEILVKSKLIIINGSSLLIRKMDDSELLIVGTIKGIQFNDQ